MSVGMTFPWIVMRVSTLTKIEHQLDSHANACIIDSSLPLAILTRVLFLSVGNLLTQ